MSIDAPTRPAADPPAPARAGANVSPNAAKHGKRKYVVLEQKADGNIAKVGEQEAATPDDANWVIVEKDGTDLNKRAKTDDPPRLMALPASGFAFEPYALAVETVVKRSPAKAKPKRGK